MRCSGSTSIASSWYTLMISSSTLGAWPNIATTLRRSFNVCGSSASSSKLRNHQPSVQFLGYHTDSSGIRMDEGKVEAIKTWPQPTTIKELQRFLGFSNFYRRFIQNYSTLTNPLTNLLRNKPKSLSWSIAAKEAFEKLKTSFTQDPILVHPDPERPFIVEVDHGCVSHPFPAAGESI